MSRWSLAKRYGADSAPRFVNGVLGALVPKQQEIAEALKAVETYQVCKTLELARSEFAKQSK